MSRRPDWRSWKLKKRALFPLALLEVGLIATILVLERVSAAHNGIIDVKNVPAMPTTHFTLTNLSWSYGLLWTALPAFLMGLYRMAWEAAVNATAERQPYVELARDEDRASSMRRTLMLDYRNYPVWNAWRKAWKRGHKVISLAIILNLIVSIAVVPLTAHLLAAAPTFESRKVNVTGRHAFNEQSITAQTDLLSVLNVASAITGFDARPPTWSTSKYAFVPFNVSTVTDAGNITANVSAYSGQLDCRVLTGSDLTVDESSSDGSVNIAGTDRGCNIPDQILVTNTNVSTYMLSWSTVQCSAASHYSRLGLVAARSQPEIANSIEDLTVLSCIPSYWITNGMLTVQYATNGDHLPQIIGFVANQSSATEIRPFFYKVLENTLPVYKFFDPSNTFETDAWGRLVYQLANRIDPASPLSASDVQSSMETAFSAFFASVASTYAFASAPPDASGGTVAQLSQQITRLYVVSPVAWTISGVLLLVLACNSCLIWLSETRRSILREEPKGLVGSAVLLQNSEIFRALEELQHDHGTWPALKAEGKAEQTRCWFDDETQRIRLKGPLLKGASTVP